MDLTDTQMPERSLGVRSHFRSQNEEARDSEVIHPPLYQGGWAVCTGPNHLISKKKSERSAAKTAKV